MKRNTLSQDIIWARRQKHILRDEQRGACRIFFCRGKMNKSSPTLYSHGDEGRITETNARASKKDVEILTNWSIRVQARSVKGCRWEGWRKRKRKQGERKQRTNERTNDRRRVMETFAEGWRLRKKKRRYGHVYNDEGNTHDTHGYTHLMFLSEKDPPVFEIRVSGLPIPMTFHATRECQLT